MYDSVLCELTYVCALASSHTQNLFVYIHILTSIHISKIISRIRWYIDLCCALSDLLVPLRMLKLWTCLYTCICSQVYIYIYHITDTFIYEPVLCELTYMFVPLQVPTLWSSVYTCIYSQTYLCYIRNTLVYKSILCKLTNGCALSSAHT